MGYLLPSENVMQLLGPLLALLAFAGEIASARTALSAAGIRADLPETVDVSALRGQVFGWVLREAVTNVVRHSGAASCVVRVSPDRIEISDDGTGFTVRPTAPMPGCVGWRSGSPERAGRCMSAPRLRAVCAWSAGAIARSLHLSEGTVRNHLSAAIGKTGTSIRVEAVREAERLGWL